MKNLITAIASLVLILAMFVQMTANQRTYNRMIAIDQLVNNFKEIAKEEGCVTAENAADLKSQIASAAGVKKSNIQVSGTENQVGRGKQIDYQVSVKLDGLLGAASFWGVSETDNSGTYTIKQKTTSEYLLED